MNPLERISVAIRHAPGLDNAEWVWGRIRPWYGRILRVLYAKHGLERVINGTDRILLSPLSRGFVAQTYEPELWQRIMREVRAGDVVVEVGANIGIYTLAFANRVGANGRVFALEPDPENAAALAANVAISPYRHRITIREEAVGATIGRAIFAGGRGLESHIDLSGEAGPGSVEVPVVALDDEFVGVPIDILKIDVEGFEEPVLRGAQHLLADRERRPRAIVVEVHPFAWGAVGTTSESILESLTRNRYRIASPAGEPVTRITEYGHIIATAD